MLKVRDQRTAGSNAESSGSENRRFQFSGNIRIKELTVPPLFGTPQRVFIQETADPLFGTPQKNQQFSSNKNKLKNRQCLVFEAVG